MVRRAVSMLVATWCVAIAAPAWAHHSMVAYFGTPEITVEGVVTEVKWRNPHMGITVSVPTPGGQEIWTIEAGGVTAAVAGGLSPQILKVGTQVKITGRRHVDETKKMLNMDVVEIGGTVYGRNQQIDRSRVSNP